MEEVFVHSDQYRHINWKIVILISGIILVLIILILLIFLFFSKQNNIINQQELVNGKNFNLKQGENINFNINDSEKHLLTVDSISNDSVTISIQSEKITLTLKIGEEKNVDVNNDGKEDVLIKLEKIENGKPYFMIKKINASNNTIDNNQVNQDKSCTEQGGVLCGNGQCPSGSKMIKGEDCCFGRCYDVSKTCSELGGIIGSWNDCQGDRVGSSDTDTKEFIAAHGDQTCCVGIINTTRPKLDYEHYCTEKNGKFCDDLQICSGPYINYTGYTLEKKPCCSTYCIKVNDDKVKDCLNRNGKYCLKDNICNGESVDAGDVTCCIGICQKSSSCTAKAGDLMTVCNSSCQYCSCTSNNYGINWNSFPGNGAISPSSTTPSAQICLIYPGEEEGFWTDKNRYNECINGKVSNYCRCGNYICDVSSNNILYNYCENQKCVTHGGSCQYDGNCNDNNSCTIDKCNIRSNYSVGECEHTPITTCTNSDSCCPTGCTVDNDNDCKRKCSDGTEINKCSTSKPKMCMASLINSSIYLVPFCSTCGCPSGLTCYSTGVCYDASAPTHYLFIDSEIQSTGFDSSKFTSSFSADSAGDNVAMTYIQESQEYKVKLSHTQDYATIIYDNIVSLYQTWFNFTTVNTNEYGDRSIRLKAIGTGGVEIRILEIQKGSHRIGFQYTLSDESKINSLATIGLGKI